MTAGALDVDDLELDRELELELRPAYDVVAAAAAELVLRVLRPRPEVDMLKLVLSPGLELTMDDKAGDDPEAATEVAGSEIVEDDNDGTEEVGKPTDADVLTIAAVLELPPLHVPNRGSQLPGEQ